MSLSIVISTHPLGTSPIGQYIAAEVVGQLLDLERQIQQSRQGLRIAERKLGRSSPRFQELLAKHNVIFTEVGSLKTDIRFGEKDIGILGQRVGALADLVTGFAADLTNAIGSVAEGVATGLAKLAKWAGIAAGTVLLIILAPAALGVVGRGRASARGVGTAGLGFTAEEHASFVPAQTQTARKHYFEANRAARNGDCAVALRHLVDAAWHAGGARADAAGAKDRSLIIAARRLGDVERETIEMLRKACFRTTG